MSFYHAAVHGGEYVLNPGGPGRVAYRDLFCQTYGGPCDVLCGGYVMMQIHAHTQSGRGEWLYAPLGEEPAADTQHTLNNEVLARLPASLEARTWFGTEDSDGRIDVVGPTGSRYFDESGLSMPLEVGYCDPRTIYVHLQRFGGFARWPYGSQNLYLFRLDPVHFAERLARRFADLMPDSEEGPSASG